MFENKILGMKKALEDKVEIEWIDAYEMESGWHDLKDAEKITPLTVFSLGYVVKDTKEFIIISADIGRKGDSDCGRVQVIPKPWVKKIKLL
jgi:hypothetical protein